MTGTVHRTGEYGMLPANYVEAVDLWNNSLFGRSEKTFIRLALWKKEYKSIYSFGPLTELNKLIRLDLWKLNTFGISKNSKHLFDWKTSVLLGLWSNTKHLWENMKHLKRSLEKF
jgi:hypothetical protein